MNAPAWKERIKVLSDNSHKVFLYLPLLVGVPLGFRAAPLILDYMDKHDGSVMATELPLHLSLLVVLGAFLMMCSILWFFFSLETWIKWFARRALKTESKAIDAFAKGAPYIGLFAWYYSLGSLTSEHLKTLGLVILIMVALLLIVRKTPLKSRFFPKEEKDADTHTPPTLHQ